MIPLSYPALDADPSESLQRRQNLPFQIRQVLLERGLAKPNLLQFSTQLFTTGFKLERGHAFRRMESVPRKSYSHLSFRRRFQKSHESQLDLLVALPGSPMLLFGKRFPLTLLS